MHTHLTRQQTLLRPGHHQTTGEGGVVTQLDGEGQLQGGPLCAHSGQGQRGRGLHRPYLWQD